jgi:hypothetical protein
MNKQETKIALIGGFVLALGATIYFWRKNKQESVSEAKVEEPKTSSTTNFTPPSTKVPETMTSGDFLTKKKTLQTLLGFTDKDVDGIIGNNTKARLQERGLPTEITTSNIDTVIKQINAKTTEADKTESRLERARALVKSASIKKMYTWIGEPARLVIYQKDALGSYLTTNSVLVVNKTDKKDIKISTQTVLANGNVRAQISDKDGRQRFIIVSPFSVTVF